MSANPCHQFAAKWPKVTQGIKNRVGAAYSPGPQVVHLDKKIKGYLEKLFHLM